MTLYKACDLWKRIRCFENLSTGYFSVQSADFYHIPLDPKQVVHLDRQYLELLAEQPPEERAGGFASLQAAVEAHDKDFVGKTEEAL